jgi:ribosomal protein S18 acetylase RimI-like enzyme
MSVLIRPALAADAGFLQRMVLAAATWNDPTAMTMDTLRRAPELWHYAENWPRQGDFGFIAELEMAEDGGSAGGSAGDSAGTAVGAGWARHFPADDPGYGFVDEGVPELSFAIEADHRGLGIGRRLLEALIAEARERRLPGVSLSVEDGNTRAWRLYESAGFVVVGRVGNSPTMLLDLA